MKTLRTFLIALFVTICSVTSFSQTTHTFYVNSDITQNGNFVDSTVEIRRGDSIKFINTAGNQQFKFTATATATTFNNNDVIFSEKILSDSTITIYDVTGNYNYFKLTVNINTLGVNDLSNINFNIFPNPTTDFLNISGAQIEALQVFDVNGRLVLSETPSASSLNLDVRSLETGFYTVLVNNQQTVRFIKE